MRQRLDAAGFESARCRASAPASDLLVRLQTKPGSGGKAAAQTAAGHRCGGLDARQPGRADQAATSSARRSARSWRSNGLYALFFVLFGFLIYISFRFELKFAIAAIITTLHDVIAGRRLVRDQRP